MIDYDEEMRQAEKLGGDLGLKRWLHAQRAGAQEQAAQARVEWEASPAGEAAGIESELRVLGASMTQEQWAKAHASQGPVPPKPTDADLTLAERNILLNERIVRRLEGHH
jgi:hypothetical protein